MGILSLLRNAFGRSRKERDTDAAEPSGEAVPPPTEESASTATTIETATATATKVPSPAPEPKATDELPAAPGQKSSVVDDLVSAAFDHVSVPKPRPEQPKAAPATTPETAAPEAEPKPEMATDPTPETAAPEADPKPEMATDPTPETAAPEADPEPKPQIAAAPEPLADETPKLEPAADETPKPKPQADETPKPEPVLAETPKPEPVLAETSEPVATPAAAEAPGGTDEPVAADDAEAPQESPAPDGESSTGGQARNTDSAEAEAEAAKPAVPAARIRSRAPGLSSAYKAAGTALKRYDLTGTRAKVYLVLDRSASMRPYYKDGSVQALAEQSLALAAHLDPGATVHVVFFSTELDGTGELTLDEHENKIDELHSSLGRMGRTSYHAAVQEVVTHYKESGTTAPALVLFQTDGAPDAKTPATGSLTDAARNHPTVFFSFIAFGAPENKAFDYLRKLKAGNAAHFLAGETPRELTDKQLYEGVLANWRP